MTTHYADLSVVPDAQTGVAPLLGALYDRVHRALVQHRLDSIGVSFPHYSAIPRSLGSSLRLHGSAAELQALLGNGEWLRGVRDHVRSTGIATVPDQTLHRTVQRKQFKSNVERLRRRRMQRKGETHEQAAQAIPDTAAEKPNLPFVQLHSLSTGQPFHLFIELGPTQPEPTPGSFNAYGLASDATIPWF